MNHAILFNVNKLGFRRPSGPHRIATVLREEGWDVEVVDFAGMWTTEELHEVAKSRITSKTVFIGFSVMFDMWTDDIEQFSKWLKEKYPTTPQILGGQWPPVNTSLYIDYYVTGYGENALFALLKVLMGSEPMSSLKFDPKYFGTNKKVLSGNTFYPSFPMKSLMVKYEDRDYIQPGEWLTIEFARGCIFKCPYCTFPILGVKFDPTRDEEDAYIQMRDAYDRFGTTNYYVTDETFNDSTEKVRKYADTIERLPFKPWLSGFIRADLMVSRGKSEWENLARMGFLGQFYGIETMNKQTAKAIKKGMDPDRLLNGILSARDYFRNNYQQLYRGSIGLVLGLPHETKDSINKSLQWLEDNWQGEATVVSALEIPTDPTVDVLSDLSIKWKDYGYREYQGTDNYQIKDFNLYEGHMNSLLRWENDHLNFNEALQIADEWRLRVDEQRMFGNSIFSLDYLTNMGMDIRTALTMRKPPLRTENKSSLYDFQSGLLRQYIDRKLSR